MNDMELIPPEGLTINFKLCLLDESDISVIEHKAFWEGKLFVLQLIKYIDEMLSNGYNIVQMNNQITRRKAWYAFSELRSLNNFQYSGNHLGISPRAYAYVMSFGAKTKTPTDVLLSTTDY